MSNQIQKEPLKPIIVPSYDAEEQDGKRDSIFKKLAFKKKKQSSAASHVVEKKEKVLRQTPMISPFLAIHEDHITMKNGYVMDMFQITSSDLYSLNEEEMQLLLLSKARFYRSYASSFKVVGLNFPSNTEKQRSYWVKKKEKTTDLLRNQFIDRKLFELTFLEKERANREFFIFIYAKSSQLLEEEKNQIVRGLRQSFPLDVLSIEKKQDVLFMLNNQNSKL